MSQNNPTSILYLGCDVAKKTLALDPALLPNLPAVDNTPAGHQKLLRTIQARVRKSRQTPHLIVEATGGYEQALVDAAHAAQVCVTVVMPRRVRALATALGQEAKTDLIDAGVLSSYGRTAQPEPTPVPTATEREVRALTRRRRQLTQMRSKEKNRQSFEQTATVTRSLKATIAALDKQIAAIDAALAKLRAGDPIFAQKVEVLAQIKGVGVQTATAVLAAVPELGTISRRAASNLAGLAPKPRDSGEKKGRRFISGGRADARCALYMASVSASNHNPVLAPVFQRLRTAGKPVKLARVAIMRRLLTYMNSLLREHLASTQNETPVTNLAPAAAS